MRRLIDFALHSVRGRIISGVLLLHATLMGLVVLDMVQRQQGFMERQVAAEGRDLAGALAVSAPSWLIANDLAGLAELTGSLKSARNLRLAVILDTQGRVRAGTDPTLFNLVLDDAPSRAVLEPIRADAGPATHQVWHDGMVDSVAAISVNGMRIGYARVLLDAEPVQAELDAVTRRGALYALAAILLGGLVAWLAVRTMTERLARLSAAADRIAAGELAVTLPDAAGRDEVARLTRDFNGMSEALARHAAERERAQAALFAEKERALVTLHSIGDAVITTDTAGVVEFLNPVAEELTGWSTADARGRPLPEVFVIINEHTRVKVENPVEKALRHNRIVGLANHTVLIRRDGREHQIEDTAAPIRDPRGHIIGVVLVFHDVTDKHTLAHQLSHQATHDALTELFNRREFEQRLDVLLAEHGDSPAQHAVLYIDLDQFKVVNDTCGHVAGDALLRQLAQQMQRKVRDSDTLARLGGDEFGVLLKNCPLDQAIRVAGDLLGGIQDFHFVWEDKAFSIGASIGLVGIGPEEAGTASLTSIMSAADAACYAAKDKGRNRIQVYHADDSDLARRSGEMHWVSRIAKAFEEERFVLYCQPIVPVRAGSDDETHLEILVRMVAEDGRLVPPGAFIPAAERYNLMLALDRWVVASVLDWMVAHRGTNTLCSINLSGQSVGDEGFLDFLVARIEGTAVAPQRLCFEITETAAIANLGRATRFVQTLKGLGCRFSLDDFGAGMSSFAYLKSLPVDYLKIDGRFVHDIADNPVDHAMVEAINNIGHVMDIETIAEYVESSAVLDRLAGIGVDYAQGYHIARPRPLQDLDQ